MTGTELLKKGGVHFIAEKNPTVEQTYRKVESKEAKFHVEIKSRNSLLKTLPKLLVRSEFYSMNIPKVHVFTFLFQI